ncbi:MAG: O-antigen ligase family protein [Planctomycetales bacterium]|nr:O-antigen ligase family protein [Planctomycetales bacterium]
MSPAKRSRPSRDSRPTSDAAETGPPGLTRGACDGGPTGRDPRSGLNKSRQATTAEPPAGWMFPAAIALLAAGPIVPSEAGGEGGHLVWSVGWLLWLMAVAATAALQRRALVFHLHRSDLLLLCGCVAMAASAAYNAGAANARAGMNMAGYWLGAAACVVALRQVAQSRIQRHTLAWLLVALTAGLALHGVVQYFVTMPALARQYESNSEEEKARQMSAVGVDPTPNSPSRIQFENRLLHSTEPYATFALANSLAGVLAPWLLMAAGLAVTTSCRTRSRALAGLALAMGACLVLTKSRTALLAVTAGGAGWLISILIGAKGDAGERQTRSWRLPLIAVAALAALLIGGILSGALDKEVLTEAALSLSYRTQYWLATLEIVRDHALTGCGSGNFQDYYGAVQLPHASELIADPHNFVLELASTGGVPAALLMLAGWSLVFVGAVKASPMTGDEAPNGSTTHSWKAAVAGLVIGWFVSLAFGLPQDRWGIVPLSIAAGGLGLLVARFAWRTNSPEDIAGLPPLARLAGICWGVALLNLLAAGGVSFWGVMQSVLLLGTLATSGAPSRVVRWQQPAAAFAVLLLIAGAVQLTTLSPILAARTAMARLPEARSAAEAEACLQAAQQADPRDASPWLLQAQSRLQDQRYDAATWQLFDEAIARDRRNRGLWEEVGRWRLIASKFGADRDHWSEAVRCYARAAELSPRGPAQAAYAWALHFGDASSRQAAALLARAALDWNAQHPHVEQRLDRVMLPSPDGQISAEQAMLDIRNSEDARAAEPGATAQSAMNERASRKSGDVESP